MKDYKKALKLIPSVLGVSINTFSNYRNIKLNDDKDIPYQKVAILERIFGLPAGKLSNFQIDHKNIKELIEEIED